MKLKTKGNIVKFPPSYLILAASLGLAATSLAHAQPPIAAHPPSFGFYDVGERERWFELTLGRLAGTPSLPQAKADAGLAELNDIRAEEGKLRERHGGKLNDADLRQINAKLDRLAVDTGLR